MISELATKPTKKHGNILTWLLFLLNMLLNHNVYLIKKEIKYYTDAWPHKPYIQAAELKLNK